jgi:hypothetical protein
MREVSGLAYAVDNLGYLLYSVCMEQEWEDDTDSPLPAMLAENVGDLLDTLISLVQEETSEMRDSMAEMVSRESVA